MKRVLAVAVGAGLMVVLGCGTQEYERRLVETLEIMKYEKRLNDNLTDAPTKGKLEELQIYVRPPKDLEGPTQTFQMTVVEPGRFDVENSFIEQDRQSMHLLARVNRPKTPAKKGQPAPEPPARGKFDDDVVDLAKNVYGVELSATEFKEDTRKNNKFKAKTLDLNAKEVQIYLYGAEKDMYRVALIFEYPKAEHNALNPKIGLCLESFAVGERARRAFAGGEPEDASSEGTGEEAAQPGVF